MKKLIALAFASVCAVPAFSQVISIESAPLDSTSIAVDQTVYAGVPGPYSAFAAGNFAQNDDYQANLAGTPYFGNSQFMVKQMQFVGGVTAVGGVLDFFFLDSTGVNVISSFSAALPSAGDFIWTITLSPNVLADTNGRLQIQNRSGGATGRWFFTSTAPTVGTNSVTVGTGSGLNPQRNQAFSLTAVPEPGTMIALGAGIAAIAARRRRNSK